MSSPQPHGKPHGLRHEPRRELLREPDEEPEHAYDEMLTLVEVAELLRVPENTMRYWRHLETGPRSFTIGRSVRYWRTDVLWWIEAQSRGARGQQPPAQQPPGGSGGRPSLGPRRDREAPPTGF